jgi:transcriptional regulator
MYLPDHFTEHRPDERVRLIRQYPLGMLVTQGPDGLDADHLPFEYDPDAGDHGVLRAHVARANPLLQRCAGGAQVLVVFRADHAYVSPSWYPSKHETHKQVPTWNYQVVHAHGVLAVHDDERYVRGLVARLTRHHEANESRPWRMGESPPDFIDGMLRAIVGIEITITRLQGKSKLGQNKETRDRLGAADALEQRGHTDLANAMRLAGN